MSTDERAVIAAVAAFQAANGCWPSPASASLYERGLGHWLNEQRVADARGTLDPFRREALDLKLPGWQVTSEEAWLNRAREASDFLLLYGRRPCVDAPDAAERGCAAWLKTMHALELQGTLRPDRTAWLDDHCPGWRSSERPVFPHQKGPSLR